MQNLPSPLNHPTLRDDLPRYPAPLQLLRVTAATVAGPSGFGSSVATGVASAVVLYVSYTEQLRTDALLPRDREPCFALNPNNVALAPGYYLGRLSGSFTNIPVYEVVCCASPIGGPNCAPPPFTYKTLLCESGVLNAYEVTITARVVDGCLVYTEETPRFAYRAGCCDCGGPTVVNTTSIYTINTTGVPPGFFFNQYDQCLWYWTGFCWCLITCCSCQSSSTPLVGNCPACTDPPRAWTIPVSGFNGNGVAFNRTWRFVQSDTACVWVDYSQVYQGVTLTGTVQLVSGQLFVTFTYATATTVLAEAVFVGSVSVPECCCPVVLLLASCVDSVLGGAGGADCFVCPDGLTPLSFSTDFTDFTGGYATFNGPRVLVQVTPCDFRFQSGTLSVALSLSNVLGDIIAEVSMVDISTTPVTHTRYSAAVGGSCCVPFVLTFEDAFTPTVGSIAQHTVTLTPACGTLPPTAPCPTTVTATPDCLHGPGVCGGSSSSSGSPTVVPCPEGLGPLNLVASAEVCGTNWTGLGTAMFYDADAMAFQATAGPGDDPLKGFGIRLTCNGDGTYNVVPALGPVRYYCGGFAPVTGILPISLSPLHIQAVITTDCCSQPGNVGGTIVVDITG